MDITAAVTRLNIQLPLKARQSRLSSALKAAHRAILTSLIQQGRPPAENELIAILGEENLVDSLQRLGAADLVVLDASSQWPVGAYPVTIEQTPHTVHVNGNTIHAMCALDAVSVAPMFATEVVIESTCHVTRTPITIRMRNDRLLEAKPTADVMIGIRWQMPSAVAAHSMCMQMVFLRDRQTAVNWQVGDTENISLFTLPEAIEFGKAFFMPLLLDADQ